MPLDGPIKDMDMELWRLVAGTTSKRRCSSRWR